MYNLVYYFLISLSFNHLKSPTLIEAKTLAHGYTFDLIHRYSPISPLYNSSITLQERYQSLALHSSSKHRLFKLIGDNNFESCLIQSHGNYLMKISLGVPPVDLYVIVDTSTDLMWVQCQPCDHCNEQRPMFDPNQSSTFQTVSCSDSQYCPNIPTMDCDSFTNECQYRYVFGNGSGVATGVMGKDILTFGSTDDLTDGVNSTFVFGCAIDLDESFDSNAAGFIGLTGGRFSLISQLGDSNRFSYCLTSINSSSTSKFRLGTHVLAGQGAATTPLLTRYLPVVYAVMLRGITIGQRRLDIGREMFIDITSMLTYIDPSVCSSLEDAVRQTVGVQSIPNPPLQDLRLCYGKSSGFIPRSEVAFQFDGAEIKLSSANIFIDLGDVLCLAIVPSVEDGDPMVLGNVAQVNFEVDYDLGSNTMSFTPKNCAYGNSKH